MATTLYHEIIDSTDAIPLYFARREAMHIELRDILAKDPRFATKIRFNESKQTIEYDNHTLTDAVASKAICDIQAAYRFKTVSRSSFADALLEVAKANAYDPLADWLRAQSWDGTKRLGDIPLLLGNTNPLPMHSRFCECWFIGAVARALKPGTKMDNVLILIGPQGAGKSQFLCKLGSAPGDYYLETIVDVKSRDGMQIIAGSWIVEWAETEQLLKTDSSAVKSFVSRQVDVYRPPYHRSPVSVPRRAVIAGTTNVRELLVDETGNRRFYVVKTGPKVNLAAVNPALLWAEAVARYEAGEPWWLTQTEDHRQALALQNYEKGAQLKIKLLEYLGDNLTVFSTDITNHLEAAGFNISPITWAAALRELGFDSTRLQRDGQSVRAWVRKLRE